MKRIVGFLSIVCMIFLFGGCLSSNVGDTQPVHTVFIVGPHANSEAINYSNEKIQESAYESARSYGHVTVITIEGVPRTVYDASCEIDESYKKASKKLLDNNAQKATAMILQNLQETKVVTPEVDILAAIQEASRVLENVPNTTKKRIIIADEGVSTTGVLNFNYNLLSVSPEIIVSELETRQEIPNLRDCQVEWLQIGEVAEPQITLSEVQRKGLIDLWSAILDKSGANYHFDTTPSIRSLTNSNTSLPYVTPVDFEKEMPISFEEIDSDRKIGGILDGNDPIFLSEETVGFEPDSSSFRDSDMAREVIQPFAEYMVANDDYRLLLIGTTAGEGINQYTLDLSTQRANAVKDTLIELGASESNIRVIGMAAADPWHIQNVGTTGEYAKQNRKVVLLNANSEAAKNAEAVFNQKSGGKRYEEQ